MARELINRIQNLRKDSGFEVTDKISVEIFAAGDDYAEIEDSLTVFKEYVSSQTLTKKLELTRLSDTREGAEVEWNDSTIRIKVARLLNN